MSLPHQYATTHEPQIAAWGNNAYAIADGVEIAVTNIAGATWTQESSQTNQGDEPWIATSGPYVYIISQTKGTQSVVHFFYSNNFGKTGSWINQTRSKQAILARLSLSTTPGSADHCDQQLPVLDLPEVNSPISNYVRVSTTNGLHWGPAIPITTSGLNGFVTQIATNGCNGGYSCFGTLNANVFFIWLQVVNVGGTHYWHMFISSSSNFGSSWTSTDVSNPTGTSGPNNDIATSSITANGASAYAVYQYQATTSSNYQVMFVHS